MSEGEAVFLGIVISLILALTHYCAFISGKTAQLLEDLRKKRLEPQRDEQEK